VESIPHYTIVTNTISTDGVTKTNSTTRLPVARSMSEDSMDGLVLSLTVQVPIFEVRVESAVVSFVVYGQTICAGVLKF